jgi:hypothetical protein
MATRTVTEAITNVSKKPKSAVYTLAELVNDLVALANEMRTDHATTLALTTALKTMGNAIQAYISDGLLQHGTLTVNDSGATPYKTTSVRIFTIAGLPYTAASATAGFSTAYTINATGGNAATLWGVFQIMCPATGTMVTRAPADDQNYTTEALAIAALPTVLTNHVQVGYITVKTTASTTFTANTTKLDVTSVKGVYFYDLPGAKTVPAVVTVSSPATLAAAAVDDIAFRCLGAP